MRETLDTYKDTGMKTVDRKYSLDELIIPTVQLDNFKEVIDTGRAPIGAGYGTRGTREGFTGKFSDLGMINLLITKSCFPAGTLVTMSDFSKKKIEDIFVGDSVLGFEEYAPRMRKNMPTVVKETGTKEVGVIYKITTSGGNEIFSTPDHPFLATKISTGGHRTGKKDWIDAQDLKVGYELSSLNFREEEILDSRQYNTGYLIAAILGDGSFSCRQNSGRKNILKFSVKDEDFFLYAKECFDFFGIEYTITDSKYTNYNTREVYYRDQLNISNKENYDKFKNLLLDNFRKNKNKDYFKGFLAGIYDAEGNISKGNQIVRISNSNLDIINEIEESLVAIDIPFVRDADMARKNTTLKSIRIIDSSSIDFISLVKPKISRKSFSAFYNKYIFKKDIIESIDIIEQSTTVYNLETESGTYIASNLAVHNCNFRCTYCVEDKDLPNKDIWTLEKFDILAEWIRDQQPKGKVCISFFGGEPLLEWDDIKIFIKHGLEKYDDIIEFNISTNIVLLDDEKLQWLEENTTGNQVNFLLSLDGFERVYSRHVTKDKKNNLMHVIRRNLDNMRDNYSRLFKNSSFRVSAMPEYLDILEEDIFEMIDYGPGNIIIHPVTTEASAPWTLEKYKQLEDMINAACVYAINTGTVMIECMEGVSKKNHNCGAGHSMLAVNGNGDIFSCYFTAHAEMSDDIIGNFIQHTANKKLADVYKLNPNHDPKCGECDKKYCFQCSVKNLLHSGEHFCSSLWCKELADLYENTLNMCNLTMVNTHLASQDSGMSIKDMMTEMLCKIEDITKLTYSLVSDTPFKNDPEHSCACEVVDGSRIEALNAIRDLSTIKLTLEHLHNKKFPENQVSSV